jgi:membrane protein DedA with SNARE-associated domain
MDEIIIRTIEQGGYWGIFFLMALENIIPPIPSELIMGLGGVLVARGSMEFWPLLVVGTIGTTAGNYFWYWLGDRFGYERLGPFIDRWGRWLTIDFEHVEQASRFFRKHGHWVIFCLRFSPFMRSIISLPAGLVHMPLLKFLGYTFAGSAIWNVLLIMGGRWLGHYFAESQDMLAWIIIGTFALSFLAYLWRLLTWTPRDRHGD